MEGKISEEMSGILKKTSYLIFKISDFSEEMSEILKKIHN